MTDLRMTKVQKHARNREMLTAAAQSVLLQKGFAKTSLREIAAAAEAPLGTLHYYFNDKSELMVSAFRAHQKEFIEGIRRIAAGPGTVPEKCRKVAASWSEKLTLNSSAYRIWYDLGNQALFEPDLRPVVREMEGFQVAALTELVQSGEGLGHQTTLRIRDYYLPMLGGLFHRFLQRSIFGDPVDPEQQERAFVEVLDLLLMELDGVSAR
ncbi:TetR/AcrR family transcriptional regulator [Paracoccus sp. IB05]|uniref:TetR/AcrR family transcriptional regulator n=1 Tax=Paracoccus sp. IB05 TaxID=2779367 RepID=UPI0018E7DD05|nr:TetR/AcrR family transcriptional regulator [Paracoccus sp. IB05]